MQGSDGSDDCGGRREKDRGEVNFCFVLFLYKPKVAIENAPLDDVEVSFSISATLLSRAWRCLRTSFSRTLVTFGSISVMHCSRDAGIAKKRHQHNVAPQHARAYADAIEIKHLLQSTRNGRCNGTRRREE